MKNNRIFTREQVDRLLGAVRGLTLGEADSKGLIAKAHAANPNKVQKGIAGDVIEVSVLGCDRDSKQEPDILVDNIKTELKTTGVRLSKKKSFEAKEPLAITHVSPAKIKYEVFEDSNFLHKIEHLLFVFYHYTLSSSARNSLDYKDFPILGHLFWQVPEKDREILKNDWTLVKEFASRYPFSDELHRHEMKKDLMLLDYASPTQPRFRFKKPYVTTIVSTFLDRSQLEVLPQPINKFSDFDSKCHEFTTLYRGKSLSEIGRSLGLSIGRDKDSCQRIIVKMFGGKANSINKIRDFQEIGLAAKTIILTSEGKRTEDMKLFQIDFDEFFNPDITFREEPQEEMSLFSPSRDYSKIYSYFAEQSFVFIVFREPRKPLKQPDGEYEKIPLKECIFEGFKRYSFKEEFIDNEVERCWEDARALVFNHTLQEINNAPSFPKSSGYMVFFRGSGSTSKDRKPRLKDSWDIDIPMYLQNIWVKGKYIVDELARIDYL